ncbi:dephospho-CoA kinase [Youngiibacter fragilis]|uniref:Dephospho-CoA kinase n=1 Tax=Youngiibacter fragilis 232.1 TaxID=994573 RepID=V7I3Y1_9CLOT|nr:dephospho-CoA kinase [Youngiibacter fragilis]ETA79899.1 dephospho-CoA kinase [Youngiibacter fragilis 232.1]
MLRIGITGGIASGKTTVVKYISGKGIPVVDADIIAREVLSLYPKILDYLKGRYGEKVFSGGELDRKELGRIIFSSEMDRKEYTDVIMPYIRLEIEKRLDRLESEGFAAAILDAPLLFEEGFEKDMDCSILVYAEAKVQLQRLMKRNEITEEEARRMIRSQMPVREKLELADFVVDNSGDLERTKEEIDMVFMKMGIECEEEKEK